MGESILLYIFFWFLILLIVYMYIYLFLKINLKGLYIKNYMYLDLYLDLLI